MFAWECKLRIQAVCVLRPEHLFLLAYEREEWQEKEFSYFSIESSYSLKACVGKSASPLSKFEANENYQADFPLLRGL